MAVLGLHCCTWSSSSCSDRGYSLVVVRRLLFVMASLVEVYRLQAHGLSLGPAAPRQVGSSRTRDPTSVSCIAGWILNYRTTTEAPDNINMPVIFIFLPSSLNGNPSFFFDQHLRILASTYYPIPNLLLYFRYLSQYLFSTILPWVFQRVLIFPFHLDSN